MKSRLVGSRCTSIRSLMAGKSRYIFVAFTFLCVPATNVYAKWIPVNTNIPDISIGDGKCSLIEAINEAQAPRSSKGDCRRGSNGPDTIKLKAKGPYGLTSVNNHTDGPNGLPSITTKITIDGNNEIIERSGARFAPPRLRIFHVAPTGKLRLNELTVQGGFTADYFGDVGAGIYNKGTLTLSHCEVIDNHTVDSGSGGGIKNAETGRVQVRDTILANNSPDAISNAGIAYLTRATVDHDSGDGCGALYNREYMAIRDSAIYLNFQSVCAGGIRSSGESSRLAVINTTVTNNFDSINEGGGIAVGNGGSAEIINSTIADNNADPWEERPGQITGLTGNVTLRNTIVYSKRPGGNCRGNVISMGHNISNDDSCNLNALGDQPNTDPLLGDLADNGGPTLTRSLLEGSPAIDAGEVNCTDSEGEPLLTDQRGRTRPADGNDDGIVACDVGAYEVQAAVSTIIIDIKPGNKRNVINPRKKGGIWVAILSDLEASFDPLQVKKKTVRFGPYGAKAIRHRVRDVNRDGLADLLLRFRIPQTGIKCGDKKATLTGEIYRWSADHWLHSAPKLAADRDLIAKNSHMF